MIRLLTAVLLFVSALAAHASPIIFTWDPIKDGALTVTATSHTLNIDYLPSGGAAYVFLGKTAGNLVTNTFDVPCGVGVKFRAYIYRVAGATDNQGDYSPEITMDVPCGKAAAPVNFKAKAK